MADYSEPLREYKVMVKMVRAVPGEDPEYRHFTTVLPAVDEERARRGASEFGYAVGEASRWQWKFATDYDDMTVEVQP